MLHVIDGVSCHLLDRVLDSRLCSHFHPDAPLHEVSTVPLVVPFLPPLRAGTFNAIEVYERKYSQIPSALKHPRIKGVSSD